LGGGVIFYAGNMRGIVLGECPDAYAGLQVSMCSGYDLHYPG